MIVTLTLACVALSVLSYLLPQLYLKFCKPQDLAKKYHNPSSPTPWAIVTGGSSGIGRAIVEQLASQGINVVVAAYPDDLLDSSVVDYQRAYPSLSFRKVAVNLAIGDYGLKVIKDATKDIDVTLVFNNAGYIKTGFFAEVPLGAQMANHHCNATSAVQITHHFVSLMRSKKLRGVVTFTSSPAGFMPCPFSALYGATKAYLTMFATSIAAELRVDGIDVCVIHPSPVASAFYDGAHKIDALEFFQSTATGPQVLADALFASVGRCVVRDQGYYPTSVRFLTKIVDFNFLADCMARCAHYLPDFKQMKALTASNKKE